MNFFEISYLTILLALAFVISNADADDRDQYELGDIPHDWRVENGEAIITVPIPFPKGVNKQLSPDLKLEYRSNNGANKELGLGWRLAGLSEIARCTKNFALDAKFDRIYYNFSDVFCLDGQRLLLFSGAYGQNSSEYRTEIDNYKRVISFGQLGKIIL